jgi:hypothetical protein
MSYLPEIHFEFLSPRLIGRIVYKKIDEPTMDDDDERNVEMPKRKVPKDEEPKVEEPNGEEAKEEEPKGKTLSHHNELIDFINYLVAILPHYPENVPSNAEIVHEISEKAGLTLREFYDLVCSFMIDPSKIASNYKGKVQKRIPTKEEHELFKKNRSHLIKKEEVTSIAAYDLDDLLTIISGAAAFLGYSLDPKASVPTTVEPPASSPPPPEALPSPSSSIFNESEEKKSEVDKLLDQLLEGEPQVENNNNNKSV